MRRKKERIFNVPPVVVWIIALLAAIEGLANLLSPETYLEILRRFAFVPGRFTFAFAPDRVSLAFNSIADDGEFRAQAAAFFLGDGRPQWWTPLTYAFLHGGWLHVGMNCLWFAAFGSAVARRFGAPRFLLFCAVAAIAGAAMHYVTHMTDLQPVAWVYWQAVEHEQQNNWGFIHADFTGAGDEYWLTKQYYAMGHYSRFIRPGFQILGVDDMNTLAAYDHASGTLVVVYANGTAQETSVRVDLSRFGRSTGSATVYRTSAAENLARLPDIPLAGNSLTAPAPAQSISTYVITALMG